MRLKREGEGKMSAPSKRRRKMSEKQSLEERLRRHPALRARVEALLEVAENATGEVVKADEAEERVAEQLRRMGQETLQAWAERRHEQQVKYWDARAGVNRKEKKDSTGIRGSGRSS